MNKRVVQVVRNGVVWEGLHVVDLSMSTYLGILNLHNCIKDTKIVPNIELHVVGYVCETTKDIQTIVYTKSFQWFGEEHNEIPGYLDREEIVS